MTEPILAVRDLIVDFRVDRKPFRAVDGLNFDVMPGEILALVGESGSGKSVTAMSILGLLPDNATRTGSIHFEGKDLVDMTEKELTAIRGGDISMIFQDPIAALNPVFTIGFQMGEAVKLQNPTLNRKQVDAKSVELLSQVGIPDAAGRLGYYPHQLSGGQCQRIMIAMALAGEPRLLIADEPTTALDVTVQAEVLDVLRRLHGRLGTSIMIITHDMGVVADLADRVVVMREGRPVETNDVRSLFHRPQAAYTQELLAAVPRIGEKTAPSVMNKGELVLDIQDLVVEFGFRLRHKFRAVDSVSLKVHVGEIIRTGRGVWERQDHDRPLCHWVNADHFGHNFGRRRPAESCQTCPDYRDAQTSRCSFPEPGHLARPTPHHRCHSGRAAARTTGPAGRATAQSSS